MENGYQTFEENFMDCCDASCTRLAYECKKNKADIVAKEQKCVELYELIEKKLGADYKLINEFDAAKNYELAADDVYIYQQGFQDCVFLLRWMGIL